MAEEMRDHAYVGTADDNRVFVKNFIAASKLPSTSTAIFSDPAFTNGMTREAIKVTVVDGQNAAAGSLTVQERVNGTWVNKTAVGTAAITSNNLIELNLDEQIRELRLKVVLTTNPDGSPSGQPTDASGNLVGLYMEINGRRDR